MAASVHHPHYQLLLAMLKQARQHKKVTQVDLAERLENTQTFISKMERGSRRLDVLELVEVLEALNVPPDTWFREFLKQRDALKKTHKVKRKISMQ
jgi:transcriptional regulator with XRE-family HTH domain